VVLTTDASLVNKIGYYIPVALFAAILLSVGSGLIATFVPGTPTGKWIGYQILYGAGRGLGLQMVRHIISMTTASGAFGQQLTRDSLLSLFSTQCLPNNSPSPWRSSCSVNHSVQLSALVSLNSFSATVFEPLSANTHPLSMLNVSLRLALLTFEHLFPKQTWWVY
jgi:hypothetical protein